MFCVWKLLNAVSGLIKTDFFFLNEGFKLKLTKQARNCAILDSLVLNEKPTFLLLF